MTAALATGGTSAVSELVPRSRDGRRRPAGRPGGRDAAAVGIGGARPRRRARARGQRGHARASPAHSQRAGGAAPHPVRAVPARAARGADAGGGHAVGGHARGPGLHDGRGRRVFRRPGPDRQRRGARPAARLRGGLDGRPAARRAHRGAGRGAERRRHRRRPHRRRLSARRGAGPAAPRGPAVPPAHQRGRATDRGLRRLADGRARRNAHPGPAQQDGQLRVQGRAGQVPVSPVPAAGTARRAARGHARGGSRPVRPGRALAHARRRRDRSGALLGRDRGLGARLAGADRGGAGRGAARPDRGTGDGPRAVSRGAPRRGPRGGGGARHGAAVPRRSGLGGRVSRPGGRGAR